ncbi:hypothetical protein [Nonomuraea sp. NPDC005692]|uniref:hypothetical protein n=1 Tax=Nonomuraea sp. NPDC005692 TaxID=3157168 RepID=UPI0033F03E03
MDFVLVTDRSQLDELAQTGKYAAHLPGSATAIALVMEDFDDPRLREDARFDLGQAMMSMMLAAAKGRTPRTRPARRPVLRLPGRARPPADRPLKPVKHSKRRPFDEVVHRDH